VLFLLAQQFQHPANSLCRLLWPWVEVDVVHWIGTYRPTGPGLIGGMSARGPSGTTIPWQRAA
jgi:hypothetical protein